MPEYIWDETKNEWQKSEMESIVEGSENTKDRPADVPLTDKEFDAWWPFSDDDLDEYERDIVESFGDYEWDPPPHLEEERRQARAKVRRILAAKYPNDIPNNKTAYPGPPSHPTTSVPDDDA